MPIVPAKCPNCAANLEVNSSLDAAICTHCGTPFIVEKAINNYQISNHISANVVNVYGNINNDFEIVGGVLKKYRGSSSVVTIPNNVYFIGEEAFGDCGLLSSVTIPEHVTAIQDGAFRRCLALQNIKLPKSLIHICRGAFEGSGLVNIDVPASVQLIDSGAFCNCNNLQSAKIAAKQIGVDAFKNCKSLVNVELLNGVQTMFAGAFAFCENLKKIKLPQSFTSINYQAFEHCKNITIEWPESFKYKQATKFLTALKAADYRTDCTRMTEIEWLTGSLLFYGVKQNNILFSKDLDEIMNKQFTIEELQRNRDLDSASRNFASNYKFLTDLVKRAGIEKDAVQKVEIPFYKEGFWGSKKQIGTLEAIKLSLIEK